MPTDTLSEVVVTGNIKQSEQLREEPLSSTTVNMYQLEQEQVTAPKEISLITPNLHMPDYGSQMTSSIYFRGMGARMEHPVMGLYIDQMPMMNKNSYDFDFFDIRRIEVLHGPQGTLYGRNTIGGVMNIYTLSPFDFQGVRAKVSYGSFNTLSGNVSFYQKPTERIAYSLGVNHSQTDGYFRNSYNNSLTDSRRSESARFRFMATLSDTWSLDHITQFNYTNQQGYAYALYDVGAQQRLDINHNDPCSYKRTMVHTATTLKYRSERITLNSVTSYSYLQDAMLLDQDFLPLSYFTMQQKQREHNIAEEIVIRNAKPTDSWQWLSGLFGFYKQNRMSAPVTFKRTGIDSLILANANQGIGSIFPGASLEIEENSFDINSNFTIPNWGVALFHNSEYHLNDWTFSAGLRLDYEQSMMKYENDALLNYRFTLTMPQFRALPCHLEGTEHLNFIELLPRLSVRYRFEHGVVYGTIAKGYKAGGFNTQIFSDILQQKMMHEMMSDLGLTMDQTTGITAKETTYKPEQSWNYEVGGHLNLLENKLQLDAALFYIDCRNQQMTIFPDASSTGRLMSNAGRTRTMGGELSGRWHYNYFNANISYGYTHATFLSYNTGQADYAGNFIPYAPQHTVSIGANYTWALESEWLDAIRFHADMKGVGPIYWNEENTIKQPFYALVNAHIEFRKSWFTVSLWGKNLTNSDYNVFYFKSMGNSFVQAGKPIQVGGSIGIVY